MLEIRTTSATVVYKGFKRTLGLKAPLMAGTRLKLEGHPGNLRVDVSTVEKLEARLATLDEMSSQTCVNSATFTECRSKLTSEGAFYVNINNTCTRIVK